MTRPLTDDERDFAAKNIGLVCWVLGAGAGEGLDEDERRSTAMLALCHAARTWNPEKGSFATHAIAAMRWQLTKAATIDSLIRIPANALNRSAPAKYREPALVATRTVSLRCLQSDPLAPESDYDAGIKGERIEALRKAIERLEPRARRAVKLRLRGHQYEAIGRELGVSKQRACQIHHSALRTLRRRLAPAKGDDQ